MCTLNRVLFQNWSIPQYALLSHYSTSSCQMHIWRIESISDNSFNSLTLHFTSWSAYGWAQTLILSSRSCRLHESCLYDPCSLLCFHYISACSQFARTDSCLLLCGRQSENIEPARSTMRLQRQHNSDSSKKCSMGRVLAPLSISHQIFSVTRSKDWVTGVNGNLMVSIGISPDTEIQNFKHDGMTDYESAFFEREVVLIGTARCKQFSPQSEQTDTAWVNLERLRRTSNP